ncbi:MAG TPA: hypothetical protein VEU47_14965 [Candidatus Cybelea sp.]|nr:hypothetical protein [Candidatus Cybelea sp.]
MIIDRRRLLEIAAGVLAASALRPSLSSAGDAARYSAVLRRADAAARLGQLCLARLGGDDHEAALVERITTALGPGAARLDATGLKAAVRAACANDFAAGRTIDVAGWILAETEVRLYALVALETGSVAQA